MGFTLRPYTAPDFSRVLFAEAPDAVLVPAPKDGVAPEGYHAMSIYPEYFKVNGTWLLAEESRMDCVAVCEKGKIVVKEFRVLKKGDLVVCVIKKIELSKVSTERTCFNRFCPKNF